MSVSCTICVEIIAADDVLATPGRCGHVFHKNCLNLWWQRTKVCPQCRAPIGKEFSRIYLNIVTQSTSRDDQMIAKGNEIKRLTKEIEALKIAATAQGNFSNSIETRREENSMQHRVPQVCNQEDQITWPIRSMPTRSSMYCLCFLSFKISWRLIWKFFNFRLTITRYNISIWHIAARQC